MAVVTSLKMVKEVLSQLSWQTFFFLQSPKLPQFIKKTEQHHNPLIKGKTQNHA